MQRGNKYTMTKDCITQNMRIVKKYYYKFYVAEYKCGWEKRLRLQIYRDLHPPHWQRGCTEWKDRIY
jgi:hypothetical protein